MPDNLSSTEAEKTEEKLKGFYIYQPDDELTKKTKGVLLDLKDLTNIKDQRHKIKNNLKEEFSKRTPVERKDLANDGENKQARYGTDENHLLMTEYPDGLLDFKNIGKFKSSAVVQRKGDDGNLIDSYDIITYDSNGEISAFIEGELGTSRLKEINLFRNIARDLEKIQNAQPQIDPPAQTSNNMETQTEVKQEENQASIVSDQDPQRIASIVSGQDPQRIASIVSGQDPQRISSIVSGQDPQRIASIVSGQDPQRIASLSSTSSPIPQSVEHAPKPIGNVLEPVPEKAAIQTEVIEQNRGNAEGAALDAGIMLVKKALGGLVSLGSMAYEAFTGGSNPPQKAKERDTKLKLMENNAGNVAKAVKDLVPLISPDPTPHNPNLDGKDSGKTGPGL